MSGNSRISLSIIIVSAFDSFRLKQTLDSLPTNISGIEIVIVCPARDPVTRNLAAIFSKDVTYPVRIVFDENHGIYPAMNLGLLYSSGKFTMFWNSGDLCYSEGNLTKFIHFLIGTSSLWGIAQGEFSWRPSLELNLRNVKRFVFQRGGYVSHQCVFAQKSTIADVGSFDTNYRVAADAKLITALWLVEEPSFTDILVTRVEFPDFSAHQHRRGRIENFKIALQVLPFPGNLMALLSATCREVFYLIRKAVRLMGRAKL